MAIHFSFVTWFLCFEINKKNEGLDNVRIYAHQTRHSRMVENICNYKYLSLLCNTSKMRCTILVYHVVDFIDGTRQVNVTGLYWFLYYRIIQKYYFSTATWRFWDFLNLFSKFIIMFAILKFFDNNWPASYYISLEMCSKKVKRVKV